MTKLGGLRGRGGPVGPCFVRVEEMREWIRGHNAEAVVWEPEAYDAALVGVGHRCGSEAVAVYDYGKLVEVTMSLSDGGSEEEAAEYVDFNILGAYVGESTPIVLMPPLMGELT